MVLMQFLELMEANYRSMTLTFKSKEALKTTESNNMR